MANTGAKNKVSKSHAEDFRGQLLGWYNRHARILPWRAPFGQKPDPYHVWLSEIMLQQTTVGAVKSYFEKFLDIWPSVFDLANASQEDVMKEWAGLGYYARARNLHKCAQVIANDYGGIFPNTQVGLKKLPGIGDYTSAAITAIAFNKPATVIDGNVDRVISRVHAIEEPLPRSKPIIKEHAGEYFEDFNARPGDLAQAFMDLGATICIPKTPRCSLCPVEDLCIAKKKELQSELPRKEKKKKKPKRYGEIYWITNDKNEVLLHRRPQTGLLAGTLALPTTEWSESKVVRVEESVLNSCKISKKSVFIHHIFTHFELQLELKSAEISALEEGHEWIEINEINPDDFPTVFKKAVKLFLEEKL